MMMALIMCLCLVFGLVGCEQQNKNTIESEEYLAAKAKHDSIQLSSKKIQNHTDSIRLNERLMKLDGINTKHCAKNGKDH